MPCVPGHSQDFPFLAIKVISVLSLYFRAPVYQGSSFDQLTGFKPSAGSLSFNGIYNIYAEEVIFA